MPLMHKSTLYLYLGLVFLAARYIAEAKQLFGPIEAGITRYQLIRDALFLFPSICFVCAFFVTNAREKLAQIKENRTSQPKREIPTALYCGIICTVALVVTGVIAFFVFDGLPRISDEINYYFQAKIFATGRVHASPPHPSEFFHYPWVVNDGNKWYSSFFPGYSAILSLGILCGLPWLVNPIIGTFSLLLIFAIAKQLYDDHTARLSVLFGLLSPFFLFQSSSFFSHPFCMLSSTAFIYALILGNKTSGKKEFLFLSASGVALGFVLNTRPLTAFVFALVFTSIFVHNILRGHRRLLLKAGYVLIGLLPLLGAALIYNYTLTGNPFRYPRNVVLSAYGASFIKQFDLLKAPLNLSLNLIVLSIDLFGWPFLSLIFVFLLFINHTNNRWDFIFLALFALNALAYALYSGHGIAYGARFYYECLPMLLILTARGYKLSIPWLAKLFSLTNVYSARMIKSVVLGCCLLSIFGYIPTKMIAYHRAADVQHVLYDLLAQSGANNALVFIRSEPTLKHERYGAGFVQNSPDLDTDLIYVRDLGVSNGKIMDLYPEKNYYIYNGKSLIRVNRSQYP